MLCLFNHAAELLPVEQRRDLSKQLSAVFNFLFAVPEELCKLFKLHNRFVIAGLHIVKRHIYHEDDLLSEIVKGNDPVKEHKVDVLKSFGVLHVTPHRRLAVAEIII